MKKCLVFLLTAICILGISGCGHQNVTAAPSVSTAASIEKVKIAYGNSALYSEEDMNAAIEIIKKQFSSFEGCELHSLSYISDEECNNDDNIAWMNDLEKANDNKEVFTQCIAFDSSFRSPKKGGGAWNANEEYTWSWWLARSEGGKWKLMTWGY